MEPQTQAQPVTKAIQVNVPQVDLAAVDGFSKVWRKSGILMVLDQTAKEFARDFANQVLRQFVIEQAQRVLKMQTAAAVQAPPAKPLDVTSTNQQRVSPSPPQRNAIVLTD